MLYASFALSLLLAVIAIIFVVLKISKKKTFASNTIFLISTYIIGVIIFGLYFGVTSVSNGWEKTFSSFYSAIKMFALGNGSELFEAGEKVVFESDFLQTLSKVFVRYIAQMSALVIASSAIISSVLRTVRVNKRKLDVSLSQNVNRHGFNKKSYSVNILYTDLEYENLKPFLENLNVNRKTINKVVILKSAAATQYGQELAELIRLMGIEVVNESLDIYAMHKFCIGHSKYKINFYSMFKNDIDNLSFGETALKFYKKIVERNEKPNRYDIDFYVSFQNESFNSRVNFSNLSNGHIKLVSEYDTVASKFVFNNPITRFINVTDGKYLEALKEEKNIHIHFIGFGNINKAMAKKLIPNYQLPLDDVQVTYHIASLNAENDNLSRTFLAEFPATSKIYVDNKRFLPQINLSKYFINHNLDAQKDDELMAYAESIVKIIINAPSNERYAKNLIFVSLGDEQVNVDVSTKLREYIKNIADSYGDALLKHEFYKSAIIHPYIKDNNFFKQNTDIGYEIISKLISNNKNINQISLDNAIDEVISYFKENAPKYNSNLCFVFETNYEKEFEITKKINISSADTYYLFDLYRDALFKYEECPIVPFGRGGYLADEQYDAIINLAKYVNIKYNDEVKTIEQLEECWNSLTYSEQQSNIGTVLSLPMKANILGYKFIWDKNNRVEDYLNLCNKYGENNPKCVEMKRIIDKCYPNFLDCHQKYSNNAEINILKNKIHLYDSLEELLENNCNQFLNAISDNLRSKILEISKSKKIDIQLVKSAYYELYQGTYEKYLSYLQKKEHKIPSVDLEEITNMFEDYFNVLYKSFVSDEYYVIRNIEHNRWYLEKTSNGVVPRIVDKVNDNYNHNKSKDKLRHLCLTTNDGLDILARLSIQKMIINFSAFDEGKAPSKLSDLSFERFSNEKLENNLYKIYKVNFRNDIFQYDVLSDYVKATFNTNNFLNPFVKKYTFILRDRKIIK